MNLTLNNISQTIKRSLLRISPQLSLLLSFLLIIIIGTILLALPYSTNEGHSSFVNALFTATSATCVTGLIVVDTGTYWTPFGQGVILALIQLGGLGIMTFSMFFAYLIAGRLSVHSRKLMEHSLVSPRTPRLGRLLLLIILLTFLIELIGAIVLTFRFLQDFHFSKAVYVALFHSISSFCNAGFSLFSDSLVGYQNDAVINITVMILIILGGLGFWVLLDVRNMFKRKRLFGTTSLHTKIALAMSFALIVFGFVALLLFEWNKGFTDLPLRSKLLASAFQAVTPRTAGFNTLDINSLTNSSLFLLLFLMLVGASPGSCGGGMKTTTFAVILAMIRSRVRNQKQITVFNRGIPEETISRAIGITFFALLAVFLFTMLLLITEHPQGVQTGNRHLFLKVIFEVFSALGTVGLSMGLTSVLSTAGKIIITILMLAGRIGPVTLALAIAGQRSLNIRLAEENFWVG